MEPVLFEETDSYEPEENWRRRALAGSDEFSVEWMTKPPGHMSPMHEHENEQVCIVLEGELTTYTETDEVTLHQYDSVWLDAWERHKIENSGDEVAVGLEIFAPSRSFDYWLDRD